MTVRQSVSQSVTDRETAGLFLSKLLSYPEYALFPGQRGSRPCPEEDVGLSTGHDGVWVSGMELHIQDHLIGGLKEMDWVSQRPIRAEQ